MNSQINIEFALKRCPNCGAYFAIEKDRDYNFTSCPNCQDATRRAMEDEQQRLGRVINSLRGVITRLNKK